MDPIAELVMVRGENVVSIALHTLAHYATRPMEIDTTFIGPGGSLYVPKGIILDWNILNILLGEGWSTPEREVQMHSFQDAVKQTGNAPDLLDPDDVRCRTCRRGFPAYSLEDGQCISCKLGF